MYDAIVRVIMGCRINRSIALGQSIAAKDAAPAFNTTWFKYGYLYAKEKRNVSSVT